MLRANWITMILQFLGLIARAFSDHVFARVIAGGTDGRFLNNSGIWTYGISGIFTPPEGSNAHGLNEKLPVKSLYEGHEFLYRLGKRLM